MIVDRTSQDVERWKALRGKGWMGMTEAERREWLGETSTTPAAWKGMYTHNDLNRVEKKVEELAVRLRCAGYNLSNIVVKTNWTYTDTVHRDDMVRYFSNISTLRNVFTLSPSTPRAPDIRTKMDYTVANDIEKILVAVDQVSKDLAKTWYYVGEIVSGEV